MTEQTLITFLMLIQLLEFLAMRHFWLRYEKAEEEIAELKKEIERKDRVITEWEKYAPFLAAHGVFEMKEE